MTAISKGKFRPALPELCRPTFGKEMHLPADWINFWSPLVDRQADTRMEPTHERSAEDSGPYAK